MKLRHRCFGFTLTELIIVDRDCRCASSVALPSFKSLTESQQVKNASFEFIPASAWPEAKRSNAMPMPLRPVTVTPVAGIGEMAGYYSGGVTLATQSAIKGVSSPVRQGV